MAESSFALYRRISFRTPVVNSFETGLDQLVSDEINARIDNWAKSFRGAVEYRIINADAFMDPRTKTCPGLESAH